MSTLSIRKPMLAPPAARALSRDEVIVLRTMIGTQHDAGCNDLSCPAHWLAGFFDELDAQLDGLGADARAQLWASLRRPPAPAQADDRFAAAAANLQRVAKMTEAMIRAAVLEYETAENNLRKFSRPVYAGTGAF